MSEKSTLKQYATIATAIVALLAAGGGNLWNSSKTDEAKRDMTTEMTLVHMTMDQIISSAAKDAEQDARLAALEARLNKGD